jgi:two-component system, OmpR family, response regulator VanR
MASILIVEDDPIVRETMEDVLQAAGHEVALAADGVRGLEILRTFPRRLVVLLDLMMPRKTGFDVLSDVVENEELASRHAFVLVTARVGTLPPLRVAEHMAALHMVVPVLVKPVRRDMLLQTIDWAEQRLV